MTWRVFYNSSVGIHIFAFLLKLFFFLKCKLNAFLFDLKSFCHQDLCADLMVNLFPIQNDNASTKDLLKYRFILLIIYIQTQMNSQWTSVFLESKKSCFVFNVPFVLGVGGLSKGRKTFPYRVEAEVGFLSSSGLWSSGCRHLHWQKLVQVKVRWPPEPLSHAFFVTVPRPV